MSSVPSVKRSTPDEGTCAVSTRYVVEQLPNLNADRNGGRCDVATICGISNVIFKFQCRPTAFEGLWTSIVQKSSAPAIVAGSGGSSTSGDKKSRCWRVKHPHEKTTALSSQLLIIALALGEGGENTTDGEEEKTALEAELATMVWQSEVRALKTFVSKLADLQGDRRSNPSSA